MKTGRNIQELAAEIARQASTKQDYLALQGGMRMTDDVKLNIGVKADAKTFDVGDIAHDQMATALGIPRDYYKKMKTEVPALLAANVNGWLDKDPTEKRMVRTLDGRARALLSSRYRPLDNVDIAEAVLPVLAQRKLWIASCEVTERRLYIKAVDGQIHRDCPTGRKMGDGKHFFFDTISPAVIITNSEVGLGALSVETGTFTRACTNMAMLSDRGMKRKHVGGGAGRVELGEDTYAMLSEGTKALTDKAVWAQVRDVVAAAFDAEKFRAVVDNLGAMAEQKIEADPTKVIELAQKQFSWTDGERGSVLKHLIEGGDLTRYGLFNAITRTAEDIDSYDRATDFERMGGQVIELPKTDWQRLAEANDKPVRLAA